MCYTHSDERGNFIPIHAGIFKRQFEKLNKWPTDERFSISLCLLVTPIKSTNALFDSTIDFSPLFYGKEIFP